MKAEAITCAAAVLLLINCSGPSPANASVQESTAASAGAFADTTHAPDPRVVEPQRTASCNGNVAYCPTPDQIRVDRSFSAFPIDSQLAAAGGGLTRMPGSDCTIGDGCDYVDQGGVIHFVSGDNPDDNRVLIKIVNADRFVGRPISALGIGMARRQAEVIANVRRFLPGIEIDCNPQHVSGNVGPVECGVTLNPGWIQIGFDRDGNLLRVRFDGYQFT